DGPGGGAPRHLLAPPRARRDEPAQIHSVDPLEDEVGAPHVVATIVEQGDDVGVVERGHHARLLDQHEDGVLGGIGEAQTLQGEDAAEAIGPLTTRTVDGGHASTPELVEELVWTATKRGIDHTCILIRATSPSEAESTSFPERSASMCGPSTSSSVD